MILLALIDHTFHWMSTQGLHQFMDIPALTSVVEDDVIHRLNVMMVCLDVKLMMTAKMVWSVWEKDPTENVLISTNAQILGSKMNQKSFVDQMQSVKMR